MEAGGHTQVLGHSLEEEGLEEGPRSLGRIVVVAKDASVNSVRRWPVILRT